jgi:hypothetical protein
MEHQILYITLLFHNADTYPKPSGSHADVQVYTIYTFEVELYTIYN